MRCPRIVLNVKGNNNNNNNNGVQIYILLHVKGFLIVLLCMNEKITSLTLSAESRSDLSLILFCTVAHINARTLVIFSVL